MQSKINILTGSLKRKIYLKYLKFICLRKNLVQKESSFIISLTTFPERIDSAWISISSVAFQKVRPKKVILVLSEEEFPNKNIPKSLKKLRKVGLDILWVKRNTRSYKKLLPVKQSYPEFDIITIDDDLWYDTDMTYDLLKISASNPNSVIGNRGWEVASKNGVLAPYAEWHEANLQTERRKVFLTSGAGTFFPKNTLNNEVLTDHDLALKLCPTADDVWIWAVCKASGVPQISLGKSSLNRIPETRKTANLQRVNLSGANDVQIKNAVDYFNLQKKILD